ncbi:chemotaxis protein CheW [Dyella subtropica]|uniref:chemotaxis protein CheW n=1 Tax=Dyella subtropica TaxID=2992127 RepID=UPI0022599542|nr:chemotaxis protein CheW [Dyella subtropica]
MNQAHLATTTTERSWLIFYLASQAYAVPLTQVSEVIRDGEVTPVPGAAADLLGIHHLRGRIVPVLDGRLRLGLSGDVVVDVAGTRIVVLSYRGHLVGLRVDAVGDLLDVGGQTEAPPPGRAVRSDDPVKAVVPWRDGFVALLDVRRMCRLSEELELVA